MASVFFRASEDALVGITYVYDFVHPVTISMRYMRENINGLIAKEPDIEKNELQFRIDPDENVHGVDYKRAFVDTTWEDQEENIAWLLLNNLFAIHEGWAHRLFEESFKGYGYIERTFVKGLEYEGLKKKFSSYYVTAGKKSPIMEGAFYEAYKETSKLNFDKLDNYMLCYRCFKEARNCFMHGNFVASQKLINAYMNYSPIATTTDLEVKEVPVFNQPVLGQRVRLSLRGVIGFSQILRRIMIISDISLLRAKAAEQEFLDRCPENWTIKTLSSNSARAKRQITRYLAQAQFLKVPWTNDLQSFQVENNIFRR